MSKRKRGSRRFLMIDEAVYRSVAWRTLPDGALRLWIDLRTLNNGHNNGRIAPTIATLRPLGWRSKRKLAASLAALVERRLLAYTRRSGPNAFHRAALVRFTDIPCPHAEREGIDGAGATCEFLQWRAPDPKPRFASPRNGGGTAPESGAQPPPKRGNGTSKLTPNRGNAKTPARHRGNDASKVSAVRSPESGDVVDVPSPPPTADAVANAEAQSSTEAAKRGRRGKRRPLSREVTLDIPVFVDPSALAPSSEALQ